MRPTPISDLKYYFLKWVLVSSLPVSYPVFEIYEKINLKNVFESVKKIKDK